MTDRPTDLHPGVLYDFGREQALEHIASAAWSVACDWHRFENAKTVPEQAAAMVELCNSMSDLHSWFPDTED